MNNRLLIKAVVYKPVAIVNGKGRSRTISISNTRKITAVKKNRREKGNRAFFTGSNPHSKGESFSREVSIRKFKIQAIKKIIVEIINAIKIREIIINIYL